MHTLHLDPRIGTLNSGLFYAFVDGYDKPEFSGSLDQVEVALGLRKAPSERALPQAKPVSLWTGTLRYQHPAWDEVDGIVFENVPGHSKSEAVRAARQRASNAGHLIGRGMHWFTATAGKGEQP